jgi:hypothetical protein
VAFCLVVHFVHHHFIHGGHSEDEDGSRRSAELRADTSHQH